MTREKIIQGLQFTIEMCLFDPMTGAKRPKEVLNDLDKTTVDSCEGAIKLLEQEPEPVYFPPCVDCQNRSKEILTAYNNMKKMQTFTKEEVITMLDKINADIQRLRGCSCSCSDGIIDDVEDIIDKYKTESEEEK